MKINIRIAAIGTVMAFMFVTLARAQESNDKVRGKVSKDTATFLQQNINTSGVTETGSGLQYKVIKEGGGEFPSTTDRVKIYFKLSLVNGHQLFDEFNAAKPWIHHINKALPGMQEALPMMKTGSKWIIFMPSELAFGKEEVDGLPAGSPVVCEMELVSVEK